MTDGPRLLLVGQVLVDVTLPPKPDVDYKLRFGGIVHAARACWALGIPYGVCYLAPSYLHRSLDKYLRALDAQTCDSIGEIDGSPNVILIGDVRECGAQGYQHLLREELVATVDSARLENSIKDGGWTDIVLFPSEQDAGELLGVASRCAVPLHVDTGWLTDLGPISTASVETLFTSTSAASFLNDFNRDATALSNAWLGKAARAVILKENRGGSRLFLEGQPPIHAPAHIGPIAHSVGVGDVFDVAYVSEHRRRGRQQALRLASLIAAAYARTTDPDTFADEARAWRDDDAATIQQLVGVSLPWEARPAPQIYIAAPDFDYMDCGPIDTLVQALRYHNFSPRRPVREFGQIHPEDGQGKRQEVVGADMRLLDECKLLIAVMLSNDPGTLMEVGIALERRVPVIVFDPYDQATNLLLREMPLLVSSDLDEVLGGVFTQIARMPREGA